MKIEKYFLKKAYILICFSIVVFCCSCIDVKKENRTKESKKSKKESKCIPYKNGKFLIVDEETKSATMQIERNGNLQKETNTLNGEVSVFNVLWINDCVAHLTLKQGNKNILKFFKDKILVMQIEETGVDENKENYYVFSSRFRGDSDKVFYQKAKLIK